MISSPQIILLLEVDKLTYASHKLEERTSCSGRTEMKLNVEMYQCTVCSQTEYTAMVAKSIKSVRVFHKNFYTVCFKYC